MKRFQFATLLLLISGGAALADPEPYRLQTDQSQVGFTYYFGDASDDGTMPVLEADLMVDLDQPSRSSVDISVDVTGTQTGFFLATQALKGASVLNAAAHPTIRFQSTRVVAVEGGARIDGDITIRGVTRPASLTAQFFRQRGTELGDRDRLSIFLTGSVNRSDFGATGFSAEVGDRVDLRILARIARAGT